MDSRLAQAAGLNQKDKATAYQSILTDLLARPDQATLAQDLHILVENVVQESTGLVIGRQVLSELAKALEVGIVQDVGLRKQIVQDTLDIIQPRIVSYEEQVNSLRFQLADILEADHEWSEAARVLMGISLDAGQRATEDKFKILLRIVRLLLEDEDSVQAETYYNRAALLAPSTQDKEALLSFKLCQARISDYSRKFLEAAARYHELSWVTEIDEDDRAHMLSAAVTCAVLAPAGPNRSRMLASLCRDERTAEQPSYNILLKMFHDRILRAAEIKDFEGTLKPHQLAKIAPSSNDRLASAISDDNDISDPNASKRTGPSTVLDRARPRRLLDLTPGAAETMARRMIEQGRLKGSIDQVEKLIVFESSHDEDDAQGKAGGLGDVEQTAEDTGAPFTKRWDMQIRITAANVESIVQHLTEKGLVTFESQA
ncbi:hypothetical protein EVJ58_g9688 [Rhodofomes roseus]|uniref:COP9 signalosome complex subunit 4 n=1 Tax=Rhodofomes roseus TaxID=34475 RepID=A0A4Y9XV34_9APHY|nr:hypothetical protein EVJ58_g9688 [Rhodofomes roseus]